QPSAALRTTAAKWCSALPREPYWRLDLTARSATERVKVTLFIPCFVDMLYPKVGISTVQILERLGHSVECPAQLACCGQPAFNSGYWDEACSVAINVLHGLKD